MVWITICSKSYVGRESDLYKVVPYTSQNHKMNK